jgi:hypothetical protein
VGLQDRARESGNYERLRSLDFSGEYSSSHSDFPRIVRGSNAQIASVNSRWLGGGSTYAGMENQVVYVSWSQSPLPAGEGDYDAAFVARIQHAAAQEPETKFNNVVDMLNWLNRD